MSDLQSRPKQHSLAQKWNRDRQYNQGDRCLWHGRLCVARVSSKGMSPNRYEFWECSNIRTDFRSHREQNPHLYLTDEQMAAKARKERAARILMRALMLGGLLMPHH